MAVLLCRIFALHPQDIQIRCCFQVWDFLYQKNFILEVTTSLLFCLWLQPKQSFFHSFLTLQTFIDISHTFKIISGLYLENEDRFWPELQAKEDFLTIWYFLQVYWCLCSNIVEDNNSRLHPVYGCVCYCIDGLQWLLSVGSKRGGFTRQQ